MDVFMVDPASTSQQGRLIRPASPTVEAPNPKRSQPSLLAALPSVPSLEQPFAVALGETVASILESPRTARIWEHSGEGSLREDIEAVVGTLENLAAWFSNASTVSYL